MIKRVTPLLLLICACACAPADNYSQTKVIEVIDGDTVKLSNGRLLRYIGIDTPEIRIKKGETFIYSPQPFSLEAKERNRELVENKAVRIEFDVEKTDRYGRLLGYCFVGDEFVNARLLQEGVAVLYTKSPNVRYVELFVERQRQARQKRNGLWSNYEIIAASQAHRYIDQIGIVGGKVLDTYRSAKCVFLNFGRDYKTDFTVVIFNDALVNFRNKNINPVTFYKGKTVEVTGKIREYNGPQILVNIPEEITVIE